MKRLLGIIWASPVTLAGLIYVLPFWALGWYRWERLYRAVLTTPALVWSVSPQAPLWLSLLWSGWAGQAIGNVIVVSESATFGTLQHEQAHVRQYMRLGVFMPVFYGLFALVIRLACKQLGHYIDNPFEVDARREAGQRENG